MKRNKNKIEYGKKYYQENKEKILETSRRTYKRNRNKILKRHKEEHKKRDTRELIVERAKARAKIQNLPFNLTKDDIILPKKCPILNIKLIRNVGGKNHLENSYSIDKINPNLGYIKNNIQIISYKANTMKSNASKKELLLFAKWILKTYGDSK